MLLLELFPPVKLQKVKLNNMSKVSNMEKNYDFSKGERGKFYARKAQHNLPVYLESEVLDYFSAKAKAKGVELNSMVNDLLKKDMELIEKVNVAR